MLLGVFCSIYVMLCSIYVIDVLFTFYLYYLLFMLMVYIKIFPQSLMCSEVGFQKVSMF